MSSRRKIQSNQANARASTGPKTVQGKARAAQNARRHGFSLSIFADPVLSAEAKNLAHEIVGMQATIQIFEIARRIAEAQIDLRRVRSVRHQFLSDKFAIILSGEAKHLLAIDRYERRALSRRKFAIRELDALCRQTSA